MSRIRDWYNKPTEHTDDDWEAWLEVYPFDLRLRDEMTRTVSFSWFVLGRRFGDVADALKDSFESAASRVARVVNREKG